MQDNIITAYTQRVASIRQSLDDLYFIAEDHFCSNPDSLTWANVGDLGKLEIAIQECLKLAKEFSK